MKLQVTQENLNKALSNVARVAASSRGSLPILTNVLLKTEDGRLQVSATNLEIAVTERIGAKISDEGLITVPARLFQEFVASLPKVNIDLTLKDNKLNVSAGEYSSTINGVLADDFPIIPQVGDKPIWNIKAGELKKALSQVVFAASGDDARPVLTGVLLHTHDGNVYAAATDSYRLSEKKIGKNKSEFSLLIPGSALSDLQRILSDDEAQVEVYGDSQQVAFLSGSIELISRLIEGNYPDYRKLLPAAFENTAELDTGDFASATKLASLFARESAGSILISLQPDKNFLTIASTASQVGENTTNLAAKVSGEGASVSLNSRFLHEGLQSLDGKDVTFSMNGALDPCVITSAKSGDYLHLIMPLKS